MTATCVIVYLKESEEMRSNSLDSKLKAKEVELKRHEQEIADQDEVGKNNYFIIGYAPLFCTNNMQYLNVQQHYLFRSKYLNSTFYSTIF